MLRKSLASCLVACTLGLVATYGGAAASASESNGKYSCTVTARTASLSGTNLAARATIWCTAAASVGVYIAVSEMDGTVEQTIQAPKFISVAVSSAYTNYPIVGATIQCPNTEVGREEYASKVKVVLTTGTGAQVKSAWGYKVPPNDTYAC